MRWAIEEAMCKKCSEAYQRMEELLDKYENFDQFYWDFVEKTKETPSEKMVAYVLMVLFLKMKYDRELDKFKGIEHLSFNQLKEVAEWIDKAAKKNQAIKKETEAKK